MSRPATAPASRRNSPALELPRLDISKVVTGPDQVPSFGEYMMFTDRSRSSAVQHQAYVTWVGGEDVDAIVAASRAGVNRLCRVIGVPSPSIQFNPSVEDLKLRLWVPATSQERSSLPSAVSLVKSGAWVLVADGSVVFTPGVSPVAPRRLDIRRMLAVGSNPGYPDLTLKECQGRRGGARPCHRYPLVLAVRIVKHIEGMGAGD